MIKIGITGGIGSGKSVVASLLALSGVPVYIADEESKWLTNNSPVIREKLTALFDPEIYTNEGLNKKLLASHIFNNPEQLQHRSKSSVFSIIGWKFIAIFEERFPKVNTLFYISAIISCSSKSCTAANRLIESVIILI